MEYLFVYGLFRDSGNPLLGEKREHLGKAYIQGTLYKVNEFYPGFIKEGDNKVWGDVYKIDPIHFTNLDIYEGDEYIRTKITVSSGQECWIYEYVDDVSNKPEIKSGDWMLR
jgi:gamma-glutamylcyclotransferase (GGCT)/AIG2-like uncharacterized protein YtfP